MKDRERLIVGGLTALLILLWLGFLLHGEPRFAGSLWGGLLGVAGALLMVVPLVYLVVKRVPPLRGAVTKRGVTMRTLLSWHIYAGILGPILAVLHTGHKFVSPLGIGLTSLMLVVVLSGFVGRYLLSHCSEEIKEKQKMLAQMEAAYHQTGTELVGHPEQAALVQPLGGLWSRLVAGAFIAATHGSAGPLPAPVRAVRLAESMSDLEYAIKTHATFKRLFAYWLSLHIVISLGLYLLLGLHVWAGIHFGLRWFQ